jgi:outer membrane receptor for ferrienterochelin and colicins
MILNKKYFYIYFSILFTFQFFSQEKKIINIDSLKSENLKEILITATKSLKELSTLPIPAQIISKDELESTNALRLNDILNEQTGLITISDFGGAEGIQLQGLDSQYILILIDGMPLIGRSAGTLDLRRVSVGNIKQIEIVKGASSSLYGSEALGGVINVITQKPKQGFNGDFNYRFGTFKTNDFSTNINFKKEKLSISTFINRLSSDGYNLTDDDNLKTVEPFNNYTINNKLFYDFSDKTTLFVSGRYYTQNQDLIASESLKGKSNINEWNTHLQLKHIFSKKWSSYFEFYSSRYKTNEFLDNPEGLRFSDSFFNQLMIKPEIRASYKSNDNNVLTIGFGYNHETLERTDFSESPIFNSPFAYLQYDIKYTEKLNIIIGTRFDSHNEYKSQFSPKASFRYKLNEKISFKGSIGYGFKAPDFRQLYFDFTNATVGYTVLGYNAVYNALTLLQDQGQIANIIVPISEFQDNLKPESSIGINLGSHYKINSQINLKINLFINTIDNLIDTKIIANKTNGQNVFSYFNINKVYTQGLELNSSWKPNNQFTIKAGYQLLYAKDKKAEKEFENGNVYARENALSPSFQLDKNDYFGLYNRSRHMTNFQLFYYIPKQKLNVNIRFTYRSKYGLYDTNGNGYFDNYDNFVNGYSIIDIAFNKKFNKNFEVGFGVDNLLNFSDYQNISNIPGQIIYGKLNIKF